MATFFDYATPTSLATNAACPQRPSWQITPVGYKWAQAVLFAFTRTMGIFRMRTTFQ